MKNVITYLKTLWGAWGNLLSNDVRHDRRLTVGSPSGMTAKLQVNSFMRFAVFLTLIFTIGVGDAWAYTGTFTAYTNSTLIDGYYVIGASTSCSNKNYCAGTTVSSGRITGTTLDTSDPANNIVWIIENTASGWTFNSYGSPTKYIRQKGTSSGGGMEVNTTIGYFAIAGYNSSSPVGFRFTSADQSTNPCFKYNNSNKWFSNYADNGYTTSMGPVTLYRDNSKYRAKTTQPATGSFTASAAGATWDGTKKHLSWMSSGTTVSLTAAPPSGKEVDAWTVTKATGGTVSVSNNQFTMPADQVTITVTWKDAAPSCTAPTGVVTGTISTNSAELTITDAEDTGTYEIYYNQNGTAPTSGTGASQTVNTKAPTITGLASGETYYLWVRAKCGESSKSDWVALTGSTFTTTCGDPSSTSNGATTHATTGGNGTQVLNWSGDPSNYEIYYHGSSTAPSPSQDPSRTVNGAKTETITGLTPGTYYWWVRSKCSSGKGDWVAGPSFTINGIKTGGTIPVAFGEVAQGSSVADKTITVTGIGLSSGTNITATFPGGSPFSVDPSSVAYNADHVTLTISASTATAGAYDQNLTLSYGGTYTATVKVTMTVIPEDKFIDMLQNTTGYTEGSPHIETGTYSTPTLSDKAVATSGTCEQQHYHFVGWITAAKYAAGTAISDGDLRTPTTASNATYYAVWAKQGAGGGGSLTETLTGSEIASYFTSSAVAYGDAEKSYTDGDITWAARFNANAGVPWFQLKSDNAVYLKITAPAAITKLDMNVSNTSCSGTGCTMNMSAHGYSGSNISLNTAADGSGTTVANASPASSYAFSLSPTGSNSTLYLKVSGATRIWSDITVTYSGGVSYEDYKAICCTDWSTPTVTYSSSLAIGGTASVSIGSGTTHGAVTYESSDEDVLTVESDGTVTAVGAGTAHIIATWAGDATYCEKSTNSNDISVSGILVTGTTPVNFGQVYQNAVVANKTISVTGINLASAITPSLPAGSPFSFSPNTLDANSSGATLTISASTATLGNYNQTLTLTSGAFSATVTVKMEVIAMPSCTFVDNLHNLTVDASSVPLSSYALTAAQGTAVVFPTLANQVKGASTCEDQHYKFVGWTTSDNNTDPEDHLVTSHTLANGDNITYYAVWADGVPGVTYTKLTSNSFSTSAHYVIGAQYDGVTSYLYSCANTDVNNSWGYCSSDPSEDTPIEFTLSGTASALVATSTEGTARYLTPLTAKNFQMSASSKTITLNADGTIHNTGDNSGWNLRANTVNLRWYDGTTGHSAYFYEVGAGSVVSYRTSCCANKVEAPTVTATKTSTSITLTWGDETGATGWEVSWNGGAFGSPSGTRTHTVSGLTPNTTYTWQVRATYDPLVKCGADIASGSTTTNQVYHVTYAKGDGEANCSATGTTTDGTAYEAGATVTLQANEFTLVGHVFAGWTEDDDDITISSNQFTMPDHDVVITASWTAKVDKYFDRMHDQTDALHGGEEETEGTNEGKYYIAKTGCNYSIPTAVDSSTGDACQTSHYKLQGWIAASYVASDGTITPANLAAHLFPPTGTKTATGATYYAVWAEVTE